MTVEVVIQIYQKLHERDMQFTKMGIDALLTPETEDSITEGLAFQNQAQYTCGVGDSNEDDVADNDENDPCFLLVRS